MDAQRPLRGAILAAAPHLGEWDVADHVAVEGEEESVLGKVGRGVAERAAGAQGLVLEDVVDADAELRSVAEELGDPFA